MSQPATIGEGMPAPEELSELVFVYGELRVGCSQAFRMEGAENLRKGEVAGTLLAISGVPGFVPRRSGERGWVTGDLFHVRAAHLDALDSVEEPGGETSGANYQRVRIKVYQTASTEFLGEAWVWQRTESTARGRIVRSGDWMEVARPRSAPCCTLLATGCLLGFFPSLGIIPLHAHKPAPSLLDHIMVFLVLVVPSVGAVAAWWGLRRRERGEMFTVLVLTASVVIAILGLVVLASFIREFIR